LERSPQARPLIVVRRQANAYQSRVVVERPDQNSTRGQATEQCVGIRAPHETIERSSTHELETCPEQQRIEIGTRMQEAFSLRRLPVTIAVRDNA
jgi:hypothetical protein